MNSPLRNVSPDITRRDVLRGLSLLSLSLGLGRAGGYAQTPVREILIRGGRIANATGVREGDVRIVGDKIAAVGSRLSPSPGAQVIEAAGRIVMPGGIDPHTHLGGQWLDDLTSGSVAALAGGITTVGTFAPTGGRGRRLLHRQAWSG